MFRFRLDSWWFGVPLLVRGPLINLPVVAATDYPPIQVVVIAMVLTTCMAASMQDGGSSELTFRETEIDRQIDGNLNKDLLSIEEEFGFEMRP